MLKMRGHLDRETRLFQIYFDIVCDKHCVVKKSRSPTFIGSIVCLFVLFFFAYDTDVLCSLGALTHRSIPLKHLNHTEVWKYFAFCLYWWKKHTNSTDHRILRKQKKTSSLKQNNKSKQNIRTQFTQAQIKNAWSTRDLLNICHFCSSTWMRVSLME